MAEPTSPAVRDALRLAAIVESSDDAIVGKDLNGIVTSWNRAAERIFGYTAEEMIGKSITTIIPLERIDEEHEVLSRIRSGQTVDHFETIRRRKDGTLIPISLTISPILAPDGLVIGASKKPERSNEQTTISTRSSGRKMPSPVSSAAPSRGPTTPCGASPGKRTPRTKAAASSPSGGRRKPSSLQ